MLINIKTKAMLITFFVTEFFMLVYSLGGSGYNISDLLEDSVTLII